MSQSTYPSIHLCLVFVDVACTTVWQCWACACTSAVGIVDGEHVDGDDLQHARAAQWRGAVLQQRTELLQDTGCHRREGLHAERHTRARTHTQAHTLVLSGLKTVPLAPNMQRKPKRSPHPGARDCQTALTLL